MILVEIVQLVVHIHRTFHVFHDIENDSEFLSRARVLDVANLRILRGEISWQASIIISLHNLHHTVGRQQGDNSDWYKDDPYRQEDCDHPPRRQQRLARWQLLLRKLGVLGPPRLLLQNRYGPSRLRCTRPIHLPPFKPSLCSNRKTPGKAIELGGKTTKTWELSPRSQRTQREEKKEKVKPDAQATSMKRDDETSL